MLTDKKFRSVFEAVSFYDFEDVHYLRKIGFGQEINKVERLLCGGVGYTLRNFLNKNLNEEED